MSEAVATLDGLPPGVRRELIRQVQAAVDEEQVRAVQEQSLVARSMGEHRSMDGIGQPVLAVHPTAYYYWVRRFGNECWNDKGFRREFARDNPAARIKARGTRIQVGFNGNPGGRVNTQKFRKVYPALS